MLMHLGTTAGATAVSSDATLSISNGINVPEPITISGTGDSSVGAIRFTGSAQILIVELLYLEQTQLFQVQELVALLLGARLMHK